MFVLAYCSVVISCCLAKHIPGLLRNILQLTNAYNIKNAVSLITELKEIAMNEDLNLCTFDIRNIPTVETTPQKIADSLRNNDQLPTKQKQELMILYKQS
jgi:hypothetical protein